MRVFSLKFRSLTAERHGGRGAKERPIRLMADCAGGLRAGRAHGGSLWADGSVSAENAAGGVAAADVKHARELSDGAGHGKRRSRRGDDADQSLPCKSIFRRGRAV